MKALAERVPAVIRSHRQDVAFLQRELLSTLITLEPLIAAPRILDVDDAIWVHRGGRAARKLARLCDLVVCGNSFVANRFSDWNKNVCIVPTGVDTRNYVPTGRTSRQRCVIGWIGTMPGFQYLYWLENVIRNVLAGNRDVVFRVVSSEAPTHRSLPLHQTEFRRWSAETEIAEIQDFDIGIMPLLDTEVARGKCSFKMLQYMACGLPVVASPVGMNAEVLQKGDFGLSPRNENEWESALNQLASNPARRSRLGKNGRIVAQQFDTKVVSQSLAAAIRSVT